MLGTGWLTIRQAQEALEHGRLEEAHRLLQQPVTVGHKGSSALLKEVAQRLVARGHQHLDHGDVVAAWNLFRWLPFGEELLKYVFAKFVEQDRKTMEQQSEGLKHNPHLMLIDDADRPAKWYFQLKQAWLDSRRTGAPFQHPMASPVTLKWRS
jgi:hypothetical protein